VKDEDVQVEILEDDRVRVRIEGEDHLINLPPGAGRMITLNDLRRAHLGAWERHILVELRKQRLEEDRLHDLVGQATDRTSTIAPPAFAELVISFLAPKNSVQALLGDLHEMFRKNADRLGQREARRKYRIQVAVSLAPLIWQWLKRIGFFTVLVDYFRSKLGL